MDAITLLKQDHRSVEKAFKAFERAGDRALKAKADAVRTMVSELSVHAAAEEQAFYPAVRSEVAGASDTVLESLEEHHIVKWVLSELDGMDPRAERFDAKVRVLIETVRHHVDEEEHELFPLVRQTLGRKRLAEIGAALERAKRAAPRHPHPRSPDEPGRDLVGATTGVG